MKLLLCLILTAFAVVVFAQRNSFALEPMDWSTITYVNTAVLFPTITKKDLLVYIDVSVFESPVIGIRRRNNEGAYVNVANFTQPTAENLLTNGKWIAMRSESGSTMFSIDENNQLSSNVSVVPIIHGFLLSDDTFVGYTPPSVVARSVEGVATHFISTFQYDAASNAWNEVAAAALELPAEPQLLIDVSSYRVYDNHLVLIDYPANVSIRIYERQADLSWDLIETVPVDNTQGGMGYISTVHYNGVDTLVYSVVSEVTGAVFFYTKIDGQWIEQTFTIESVGYRPVGYLGLSVAFMNANNVLVSAGGEGLTPSSGYIGGKILYLTRGSNGQWEAALDLTGPGLFGVSVAVNDYDIIVPSLVYNNNAFVPITYYTAPFCFTEPINVTCNNMQIDDCSDVSIDELYTHNNPRCGAISASVNGFSFVNNQAVSQLTFTRGYGDDVSCAATVTCPAPPVVGVAPVTNTNVSGSEALQFGLVASVLAFAALLL